MSEQDLKINQLAAEGGLNRAADLAQLFPEAMTDGKVDVEKLRLLLGEEVDDSQERYGLTWPGKREAIRVAQKQSTATLAPMPDDSVDWSTTKNMIIEGDNLEVLKLLQKSYYGKIKLIYIDPPYNTGKDFVYDDNYAEPTEDYLRRSGQIDGAGFQTSSNREVSGRFHSGWLSMMYPRLMAARNLLQQDGLVFISIDEREVPNLRTIMDEIYGPEQFIGQITWQRKKETSSDDGSLAQKGEYLVVYSRQTSKLYPLPLDPTYVEKSYKAASDKYPDGRWRPVPITASKGHQGGGYLYSVTSPTGVQHTRTWLYNEKGFNDLLRRDRIYWGIKGDAVPQRVMYASESAGTVPDNLWLEGTTWLTSGTNKDGKNELTQLIPTADFQTVKPTSLMRHVMRVSGVKADDCVLDFFAGSGSTADAVMQQNAEDGGGRRFILVQLPEATKNPEFPKISDITRERVRRAGTKIKAEAGMTGVDLDVGFRAFKLGASNFRNWDVETGTLLAEDLEAFVDNINTNASDDGIVHEILLKAGIRLDTDLQNVTIAGVEVTLAVEGLVAVSANRSVTQDFIDGVLALEPQVQQLYLLDAGFGDNDSLKVNARHQFAARRSDSDPDKDDALRTV